MHKVLQELKLDRIRIFGFDSFEGMPDGAANEDNGKWKPRDFASSIQETKQYLNQRAVDWKEHILNKGIGSLIH